MVPETLPPVRPGYDDTYRSRSYRERQTENGNGDDEEKSNFYDIYPTVTT